MTTTAIPTAESLIADATAYNERIAGLKLVNMIAAYNTVVMNHAGMALDFEFVAEGRGKRRAVSAHIVPLWKARQFSPADARALAASVTDGAGRSARAVYINDAVDEVTESNNKLIELLKAHAA